MQAPRGKVVRWRHVMDLRLRSKWPVRSRITQEEFHSSHQRQATRTQSEKLPARRLRRNSSPRTPATAGGDDRRRGQRQRLTAGFSGRGVEAASASSCPSRTSAQKRLRAATVRRSSERLCAIAPQMRRTRDAGVSTWRIATSRQLLSIIDLQRK